MIVHYEPIEAYPPVINMLRMLREEKIETVGFSIRHQIKELQNQQDGKGIRIVRFGKVVKGMPQVVRLIFYLYFHLQVLIRLIFLRPKHVLYYETMSSFAVVLYKKWMHRNCKVYIHYHEYTSKEEYNGGMKIKKFFHQLEKGLYPEATWVSHTNPYRMEMFKKDVAPVTFQRAEIVPNYPPQRWTHISKDHFQEPLRIIYVGAIGMDTMYTKQFAQWVLGKEGKVIWDLYSYNVSDDAHAYFSQLDSPFIRLLPGMDYDKLPSVIQQYDIGVIMYIGFIPNHVYSVSNKLYEYLVCGLQVWFPQVILGSLPYCTHETYPEIFALDFTRLEEIDLSNLLNRSGRKYVLPAYFCEEAYRPLISKFKDRDIES